MRCGLITLSCLSFSCKKYIAASLLLFSFSGAFAQPDTWVQKTNFGGTARERTVGMSINGFGYMGTGVDAAGNSQKDWWRYDPGSDSWSQMASMPIVAAARNRAIGLSISGRGYVGTGRDQSGNPLTSWFEYDPVGNSWNPIPLTAFPGSARFSSSGFVIGNKGYVGIGFDGGTEFSGLWEYNPASDTWISKTNFPGTPRYSASAFSIGGFGYIGAGYDNTGNYVKDFYRYDPVNDSWIQIADLPTGVRAIASGFSIGNRGFVVGGSDASNNSLQTLWEYNPAVDFWTQRASIPIPHQAASAFVIGGKAYVGTGNHATNPPLVNNLLNDLWQYTPATNLTAKFQKSYGGTSYDSDTANIAFASPTWDGGYIISSTTRSFGNGGDDVYLIKTGALGNIQWQKTFGTTGNETSSSAMQTGDGGFIVAGATRKQTDEDMLILKISSAGGLQWTRSLGGTQNSRANYAEETQAGGEYLIVGKGEMTGPTVSNSCLLKFSANGTQVLGRNISVTSSVDEGFSLEQTAFGNYLLSGNMKPGAASTDAYIVGVDNSGGFVSGTQGRYDSPGAGTDVRAIARQTADGGFIVCGSSNGTGTHGLVDFFLLKIQNNMAISWGKIYGGAQDDFARSIAVTNDGNFAVAGYTKSFGTATDAFLSLINPTGTVLWTKTYGGTRMDRFNSVYPAADGGYVLCGETFSFSSPSITSDIYLVKTDSIGNSGCNESSITLTPNNFGFTRTPVGGTMNVMTAATPPISSGSGSSSPIPLCSQCTFPLVKTKTNVKCFGGSTGSAAVAASGGTTPYTYVWSTGASTSAVSGLPIGTYTVFVVDAGSCSAVDTIKIMQPPKLIVTPLADSVNICKGNNATIGVLASGGSPSYGYSWSPSGGLSCSTCQNTIVSPTGSTAYLITVTDSAGCIEKDSVNVIVHSLPTAGAGPDQTICGGSTVNIGGPSIGGLNYSWSPPTGLSNTSISNPLASPTITTNYVVTTSNAIGCSDVDSVQITVIGTPTLSISVSGPATICSGTTLSLTASSNAPSYQWNTGSSAAVITVTPSASTVYSVYVLAGSCTVSASQSVTVIQTPTASITHSGSSTVCSGTTVLLQGSGGGNYTWSNGATGSSISVTYSVSGTYINTLTVTAGGNLSCSDTDVDTLTVVSSPVVNVTATSYTLCTGVSSDTLIATNLSGANYTWAPGLHPNNDTIIVGPYSSPGTLTYTVVVSNGPGCSATATVTLNVSPGFATPSVTPNPANYCFGDPVQPFTCVNAVTFVGWTDVFGNPLQFGATFTPTVTAVNSYTFLCVQGTGKYCLSVPKVVTMNIHALPVANAGKNITICSGHTAALQASGGTNYLWSPNTSLSSASIANPSADPDSTFSWQVRVTDLNGCKDIDSVTVFVIRNDTCGLHVFNVITPNSDGFNEGWWIDGIASFPENSVKIFNRWGIQVWAANNYDNKKVVWKGQNNSGEPLPTGTYYYVIHVKNTTYSKWVELVR